MQFGSNGKRGKYVNACNEPTKKKMKKKKKTLHALAIKLSSKYASRHLILSIYLSHNIRTLPQKNRKSSLQTDTLATPYITVQLFF